MKIIGKYYNQYSWSCRAFPCTYDSSTEIFNYNQSAGFRFQKPGKKYFVVDYTSVNWKIYSDSITENCM